jgi:hypothetical protein
VPLLGQHALQLDASGNNKGNAQQSQADPATRTVAPVGWPTLGLGPRNRLHILGLKPE